MFGIGTQEMMLILVIILVLFGGSKLPELAKGLGKSMKEFKKGLETSDEGAASTSQPTAASAPPPCAACAKPLEPAEPLPAMRRPRR